MGLLQKIFGSYSDKEVKLIQTIVYRVLSLKPEMMALYDEEIAGKTN